MCIDWSAVTAVIAVIVAVVTWWYSSKSEKFKNLNSLLEAYRSPEMYRAVDGLWHMWRNQFEQDTKRFVEHVLETRKSRPPGQSPVDKISDSIDGKRRLVSHFYRQLATLFEAGELPKEAVLEIFREDVLAMIPTIIQPLENAIAKGREMPDVITDDDDMLKLYRVAKKRKDSRNAI